MKFVVILALASLLSAPAFAQTAPKPVPTTPSVVSGIAWGTVLKMEDGKPYIDDCAVPPTSEKPAGVDCKPLTIARAVAHALFTGMPNEHLDADTSFARGMLAHQIQTNPPTHLDTDQAALIKKLCGIYPTVIVFQMFPVLFPNDKPGALK